MQSDYSNPLLNRRTLLTGAGILGMAGIGQALAGGHTGNTVVLTEEQQLELEKRNAQLVTDFCNDYAKRDVDTLLAYVHDDIIYQITEGMEVNGIEEYRKHLTPMLAGLDKVDWQITRQTAIGQLVINDRVDEFYPFPGSSIPRMRFRVAGYFWIVDDKIKVWRDFSFPGSKQLIEPAPKA
jgi:limonene-1,2-epoxide hydrolase